VVDAICTHPDIKAISFVGSTAVGTHVYNLGSQHGKRVQSMMGAKNHAWCCPTPTASRRSTRWSARASARPASAAWRLGGGAGRQRARLAARLVAKAKTLKVNAGSEPGTDVGPVVSRGAKARILSLIDAGVKEGAKLELDGRDVKVPGYEHGNFVGPTLFSGVTTDMRSTRRKSSARCW
jgi:malonate-semialdehyde dehydrogenase (acetylating)/methylmalonate-semialdehyde dehydrogenase